MDKDLVSMRSNLFLQCFSLLIISSVLLADTPLIRTTVSDSSRVVFIAQTPLFWERVEHDNLRYGVFADWDPLVPGADTFVLPSEMQALAWENNGDNFGNWPTGEFSGASINSPISPTTLGNINNSGYADVVFSTLLDGKCVILAYDSDAEPPDYSDFPITLPDNVTSYGGFSIADIDRDGVVEMVFGTSDGYLHCWELGACTSGYAPWPQFQHDEGRTGVLQ